jgi:hypothetical protein
MANNDCGGFYELLDLLKTYPDLIKELVFNPDTIQALPSTNEAKRLALGVDPGEPVDARTFLNYVAGPADGYPITQCLQNSSILCAKGTKYSLLACLGGTGKNRL